MSQTCILDEGFRLGQHGFEEAELAQADERGVVDVAVEWRPIRPAVDALVAAFRIDNDEPRRQEAKCVLGLGSHGVLSLSRLCKIKAVKAKRIKDKVTVLHIYRYPGYFTCVTVVGDQRR